VCKAELPLIVGSAVTVSDKNIPDLSSIKNCMKKIKNYLRPNQLLILESSNFEDLKVFEGLSLKQ